MYKCDKCKSDKFETYDSLRRHVSRVHGVKSTQLYVDYYLKGIWPVCKCGCGQKVKWSHELKSFRDFVQGHQSRVHNNWGHNKKAAEKSAATRRKKFANGELAIWNKGLTKEISSDVANYGRKHSEYFTAEVKKQYSERMRANRLTGIVPTLHGKDHSQWKGGASSINILVRARVKLYTDWKYPILTRDGFQCVQCGSKDNLHIHHDKETMSEIIQKHIVDGEPTTFELKEAVADAVVKYHISQNVSGITLCGKCHEGKHPSLNFQK